MKDYQGKVLKYDEGGFIATISKFSPLLRAVDEVGKAYEALDTGFKFTQSVFADILSNDLKNISISYTGVIEAQIKASKFTSKAIINGMRANIPNDLSNLSAKIKALRDAHTRANSGSASLPVDLEFIKIESGSAILNDDAKEAIKEIFTIKVRTEEQNKLYNLLINLKEHYENLTSFMKDSGINVDRWGEVISDKGNGLAYEQAGELIIDPNAINIKLNGSTSKQQILETEK